MTPDAATPLFHSILVGVDGSENALNACRLADRLRAPSGQLLAVAVAETVYAIHTGFEAPGWAHRLRQEALAAQRAVLREFNDPNVRAEVCDGRAAAKLLALARERDADLVAVGRNRGSRSVGLLMGSVASRLIHEASCSVLVAHDATVRSAFPQKIVVGLDRSESAGAADRLAQWLTDERGAEVHRLIDARDPVDALVDASADCDLLIVGSRGLHGIASLGSVAERVAHAAKCSVLIVWQRVGAARQVAGAAGV
jgi:nucleotide-binding universal stress UspA family protein